MLLRALLRSTSRSKISLQERLEADLALVLFELHDRPNRHQNLRHHQLEALALARTHRLSLIELINPYRTRVTLVTQCSSHWCLAHAVRVPTLIAMTARHHRDQ